MSDFQLRVMSNTYDGQIYGVQNSAKIRLMMRAFTRSIPASTASLLILIRQRRSMYSAEYSFLENFRPKISLILGKIQTTVSKPTVDYKTLKDALFELRDISETVYDVMQLLSSRVTVLEKAFRTKRRILARIAFLKRVIQKANNLIAQPKSKPVGQRQSGIVIKYTGRVCFHALCFEKMQTSVIDSKYSTILKLKNPDSLLVSAVFTESQNIAGLFNVTKNSLLRAEVSRNGEIFSLEVPVTTKILGQQVQVKLKITPTEAGFSLPSFKLSPNVEFDLKVSAKNSKTTTWQSLFFSINGLQGQNSKVPKMLESLVADYITQTSKLTKKRLTQANTKVAELRTSFDVRQTNIKQKKIQFDHQEKEHAKLQGIYQASLARLGRNLKTFRSYRVSGYFRDLEEKLNATCVIGGCNQVCLPVVIYSVCQDSVKVDANTLVCKTVSKKAISTIEQPLQSECQLTDYRFRTIYTGTCKRGKDAKLTGALVATGAGVGALVGGPVGAAVGAVVGFIGGLFSSCDETYAVDTEVSIFTLKNISCHILH